MLSYNFIIFFKFFDNKNYFTKTLYLLASILSLSVNPLNGMILVSQFLYFIFVKKKIILGTAQFFSNYGIANKKNTNKKF